MLSRILFQASVCVGVKGIGGFHAWVEDSRCMTTFLPHVIHFCDIIEVTAAPLLDRQGFPFVSFFFLCDSSNPLTHISLLHLHFAKMKIIDRNLHRAMASTTLDDNAMSTTTKSPTTFLTLPAELRNTIYTLFGNLESIQSWDTAAFTCVCVKPTEPQMERGSFDVCSEHAMECLFCENQSFRLKRSPHPSTSLSLWVNRNSNYAFDSRNGHKMQSLRSRSVDHFNQWGGLMALTHAAHIRNGVEQPALTKVSKQVRNDTLPIFYGSHSFLFALFDREVDSVSIFKWVRSIGKDNAGMLRTVKIVVRSKRDQKYVENELIPALKRLGLQTEGRDVKVFKLSYPYCYCERCVRTLLGEV